MGFSDPTIHGVIGVEADYGDNSTEDHAATGAWVSLAFDQGPSAFDRPSLDIHFTNNKRLAQRVYSGVQSARWVDDTAQNRSCVAAVALGWHWNAETEEWEREPRRGEENGDNPVHVATAFEAVKLDLGL